MAVKKRTPEWCKGWMAGFCACAFLFAGYRKDYERDRDEYLARKGWQPDPKRAA